MRKRKLVLYNTDLRVLLGLTRNVEIMFVEASADPVSVQVHLTSPDFPDQDMSCSGWRDYETEIISAGELAELLNPGEMTFVCQDGTKETHKPNLLNGMDGLKVRQPSEKEKERRFNQAREALKTTQWIDSETLKD